MYHFNMIYCLFRCSVFLIDQEVDELVAKVFDGALANDNEVRSSGVLSCSDFVFTNS